MSNAERNPVSEWVIRRDELQRRMDLVAFRLTEFSMKLAEVDDPKVLALTREVFLVTKEMGRTESDKLWVDAMINLRYNANAMVQLWDKKTESADEIRSKIQNRPEDPPST